MFTFSWKGHSSNLEEVCLGRQIRHHKCSQFINLNVFVNWLDPRRGLVFTSFDQFSGTETQLQNRRNANKGDTVEALSFYSSNHCNQKISKQFVYTWLVIDYEIWGSTQLQFHSCLLIAPVLSRWDRSRAFRLLSVNHSAKNNKKIVRIQSKRPLIKPWRGMSGAANLLS